MNVHNFRGQFFPRSVCVSEKVRCPFAIWEAFIKLFCVAFDVRFLPHTTHRSIIANEAADILQSHTHTKTIHSPPCHRTHSAVQNGNSSQRHTHLYTRAQPKYCPPRTQSHNLETIAAYVCTNEYIAPARPTCLACMWFVSVSVCVFVCRSPTTNNFDHPIGGASDTFVCEPWWTQH